MGPRSAVTRASACRLLTLVTASVLALGCVARAQGFEAWNAAWRADLSDRTGTVTSIKVLDRAGPGADLVTDSVRIRNLDARTIEVAWLGGRCVTDARFSLAPEPGDTIGLRYEIGGPCAAADATGYALEIQFARAVAAATIDAVPDWGP